MFTFAGFTAVKAILSFLSEIPIHDHSIKS
jgi:hypothetical protein